MSTKSHHILWVDDEINLLKPHIIFLKKKGYQIETANNGRLALEYIEEKNYDVVLLDENMPGISGLEVLEELTLKKPHLKIIMITKSEEENIMEEAIGSHIADYLIKPVNPNQILLSLKRVVHKQKIINEKTTHKYQVDFRTISLEIAQANSFIDWVSVYEKIVSWEINLEKIEDTDLKNILENQKEEANTSFCKFVERNYTDFFNDTDIVLSHEVLKKWIVPEISKKTPTVALVLDNLRYDQWVVLSEEINKYYHTESEKMYSSILPSATQYARNALFAGLTPKAIHEKYPKLWKFEKEEGSKNKNESELLQYFFKNNKLEYNVNYFKILTPKDEKEYEKNLHQLKTHDLSVLVYNFIDILSHSKTDSKVIRQLAHDDKSYRHLTLSWFKNSKLIEFIQYYAKQGFKLIITTDHGTINVKNPTKVIGTKEINDNLRYKSSKQLTFDEKEVLVFTDAKEIHLPQRGLNHKYIFTKNDSFFAYPNNFNHYVKYFKDTYQHGGVSLEEMIIPFIVLSPK